jgi:chaperonin GroES
MEFKPLRNQVILELEPVAQTTESGIIIPDSMKDAPLTGTVIAIGPGKKNKPMEVKVGDKVLFGQYSGRDIEIEGSKYILQIQDNILGILNYEQDEEN